MATPEEQLKSMLQNLPEKTGKPMKEWLSILRGADLAKHGEMVKLLKAEYGVTHGFANLIVHEFRSGGGASAPEEEDLVASQYAGKETLRPIHDRIMKMVAGFGGDVEVAPKKAYVSLRRNKQFALVQPSTKTRMDVGIRLTGTEAEGRLETAGSWNSMVSHRVRLSGVDEVDDELKGWLRKAYEEA